MPAAPDADRPDTFVDTPELDSAWESADWERMLAWLVDTGLVTWKEVGSLVLGHLNPSQVGTSIASKKTFQAHYPPRKTMQAVYAWHVTIQAPAGSHG